ncbi:MAG: MFS transporter [Acidimicrobiia bacterium]|nr:MFS transporter [Acidimicrobiia bacterium]
MEQRGMRAFLTVWIGQLVSVTGTAVSGFGLQFFVFVETGSVTQLSLVALAFALPAIVFAPLAGSIADRYDRKRVMLLSDVAAGAATLALAALHQADALELWHIYTATAIGATANTFQDPAWQASIPMLVARDQLGRANGLVQLNQGLSIIVAPAVAGALLATLGLGAVLLLDVVTFGVGVATLLVVRIPQPVSDPDTAPSTVREDSKVAWRYLRTRPGLFWLLWIYAGVNFMLALVNVLFIPLVASFASESAAGGVLSAAGAGAVAGSIAVAAWGGPKRLVRGIFVGIAAGGVFVVIAGLRPSVALITVGAVGLMTIVPVVNTASQIIWQTKVEPAIQGRAFSLRRMISSAVSPMAILLAGPLADAVFEPAMTGDGSLTRSLGSLLGTGEGRGIGLMVVVAGLGTIAMAIAGLAHPRVRSLETELADHDPHDTDVAA